MPIELILLASGLNTLLPRLWEHRKDQRQKKLVIDANLVAIKTLSTRLGLAIEDPKFKGDGSPNALSLKQEARTLTQETLDSIQLFFRDKYASNTAFEVKTKEHRQAIKDLCERVDEYTPQENATKKPDLCGTGHTYMAMEERVEEVLKLIGPSDGGRKVISIVGFPGIGKTFLANLVYDRTGTAPENSHLCTVRASVSVSNKEASEVLTKILEEVDAHGERPSWEVGKILAQRLHGKRYFILIDDMQRTEQWTNIEKAFPEDGDGTIIVTTSIQSVANQCSRLKGYVYNLSPLDKDKSLDLFMKGRSLWTRDSAKMHASDILKKCDGLPLAIVSMSKILERTRRDRGVSTSDACRTACTELGTNLLMGVDGLERLRWVLMNEYTGLTCDALRSCLLYYCLYKHNMDAVPRRNSLIRRWEAEGFLVEKYEISRPRDVADKNLITLVDRNIMQSMEVGTNGSTRRCRPPGMMLEYISSISKYEKFAAAVSDAVPSGIRRLSFYHGSATDVKRMSDEDLKLVLTLEVSGIGCEAILDFKKYELIAVLEMKECTNLKPSHVKDICKLVLLKYLSLGISVKEIPGAIGDLKLLETLEMSRDGTVLVHEELLELPNLKHLLGKFQLVKNSDKKKQKNFLSGKSGIETVTGFVTYMAQGFPKLMHHMKRLRKVKIHCTPTATDEDQKVLQREIKAFTREGMNGSALHRSLSVDFTEFTPGIQQSKVSPLEFLKVAGSLDSLKLRGDWRPLLSYDGDWRPVISADGRNIPDLTKIIAIKKLCLSGTRLSGEDVLAGLANLIALEYLKLEEEELGPLEIKSHTFKELTRLCLVGEKTLHGITIETKALPKLLSLHLICKALDPGLESSIQSGGVERLNEIALDSEVKETTKGVWKTAAKGHPNRPQVLLIKKGAPIRQA